MTTSTADHIARFLMPIHPQGAFRAIMEAIVTRAKADSSTERAVQAIKEWLANPLVSPEAEAQLRSHDPLAGDVPDLVASPSVRLGLAVGYLRAEEATNSGSLWSASVANYPRSTAARSRATQEP